MVKRGVVMGLVVIILGIYLAGSFQAQTDKFVFGNEINDKVEEKVYSELKEKENVSVIIKYKDKIAEEIDKNKKGFARASSLNLKETKDIDSSDVTLNELNKILESDEVDRIWYNYPIKAFMQETKGIVEADISWIKQAEGINLTGLNQTICIIDTGVNYTHPDLGGCYGNNSVESDCKVIGGHDFVNDDDDPDDDNGHGTHVAGIAAASGNISGIAPGSKIVAIKVLNNAGSGSTADLIAGIRWCYGNSSLLNISVISMSLGTDCYADSSSCAETFCNDASTAEAINIAVGMNISVVVATGNNGNITSISQPACVQNSTRVGSVYDKNVGGLAFDIDGSSGSRTCSDASTIQDKIACYSNRGGGFNILLAPGSTINSSKRAGGYEERHGTSMATPVVAGAIAILKQYLQLVGRQQESKSLEAVLNNTGLRINDTGGLGINMTRINLTSALLSLDSDSPNISLVSPRNNSASISLNQNFSCFITDLLVQNVTLNVWNSTNDLVNQTNASVGVSEYYHNTSLDLTAGDYYWNCESSDSAGNFNMNTFNSSLSLTTTTVSLISPSNNSKFRTNATFDCSAETTNTFTNITLEIWNSTDFIASNYTNVTGLNNATNMSLNFVGEGEYLWNCKATSSDGIERYASSNYTIHYDLTAPEITIVSPLNNSWQNAGRFNVSLNENGTCMYGLRNGVDNRSMNQGNGFNFGVVNSTLIAGNYNVTYYCNDSAGNWNSSQVNIFYVDLTAPTVTLVSPTSNPSATGTQIINFTYSVSENKNMTSCALILNGASVQTNSTALSLTNTNGINRSLGSGSYTWTINCTDYAGNVGTGGNRSFVISSASEESSESSAGGGGGTVGTSTITSNNSLISASQIKTGTNINLKSGESVRFNVTRGSKNEQHRLLIKSITNTKVSIVISSTPQSFDLNRGDVKKVSLINSSYYDLKIQLVNISSGKALIKMTKLDEKISSSTKTTSNDKTNSSLVDEDSDLEGKSDKSKDLLRLLIILFVIAVIALVPAIIIFLVYKSKNSRRI